MSEDIRKNMAQRLSYYGGAYQLDRMNDDKLRSLRYALKGRSYACANVILADDRKFRALINPNKLSMELDDKMLSIPFEDINLNAQMPPEETTIQGMEEIGVKVGDVICWEQNNTHWLVYMQYLQETAYFKGLMRQCDTEPIEINGNKYWVYIKGPDEKTIDWTKSKRVIYNELNYTLEMYITKNDETLDYFHRFTKVEYQGKPWQVQAVDSITTDGLIVVYMKEYFTNEFAQSQTEEEVVQPNPESPVRIEGKAQVYPYDTVEYKIVGAQGGSWLLSNQRAKLVKQDSESATVEITTGRSGDVSLIYRADGIEDIIFNIKILSL